MEPLLIEKTARSARTLLFWHPDVESLALSVLHEGRDFLERGDVTWARFPDGWPNICFASRATLEGRDAVFITSMHHPSVVVEQHAFLFALARQRLNSLHVYIPYFGPGTMERVSRDNEVATAEPFFKLLTSGMPPLAGGTPTFTVFDAHALCTRFYAADTVTVVEQSAFSLAMRWIVANNATVVFPDDGAAKRFAPYFHGHRQIVCAKKRGAGDERSVVYASTSGVPSALCNAALIVDDLCQTGGTLAECARLLSDDFGRVSAFVVHAVFPNDAHKHFLPGGKHAGLLEMFFVCNTNPSVSNSLSRSGDPFCVLDVAPLVAVQLRRDAAPRISMVAAARRAARESKIFRVTLASSSAVKLHALDMALSFTDTTRDVSSEGRCSSRVSEQPLSESEAWLGAENRLATMISRDHTLASLLDCNTDKDVLFVSIESGLWQRDNVWCDSACVILERRGKFPNKVRVLSAPVAVPERFVGLVPEAIRQRGSVTLGTLIHNADASLAADEWFDRAKQLGDAIVIALEHV